MKMDKNTKIFLAIGMILAFSFVAIAVTMEDESDALSYTYVDNYSAVQLNQRYMTSHTSDTTVKKVDFPTITGARVYTSDSYSTQVVEDTGTYTTENSSIISGAVKRIYFIPTATNVSITMRWTTSSDWFDWSHSETFVFTTNPTEYGNWRTGSSSGTTITSLTMEVGDSSTVYFTSPVSLTNATFSSSTTSVASITSSSIGTQYYWTVNLHANAAGTSTIRASYSSGTSIYYKDLSITVNQPISTTFYRNYTSTDSTVIDTITQTVGSSFSLPSDPIRSNYTFSGWYTARSGGTQVTSSTTVTSSSPTTLYAHWASPTEYGNYKSGSYSGTTITSLAMKVGQTTTVYFTSAANISSATFTSSNSSIVHVDSTGSGTVYQRSITLTANATGTVTLKAQYMSGSTAYYKDLSITVTEISTKFYRNNSSSDTNVVATISQVVGDYFDLPSNPVRQGYTFTGWFTSRTGGTQITSSTTVTTSSPTAVYAHWGEPSEYGTYKSGSYSGTTITSLAMKVGETTTVYFTSPVNISSATFTSSNASIVHVDSTGSGTVYQRSITLTAYATGTVTLKAQYSSGSTSYYKDLSITVTQLSTTFYRNYDSSDSTVVQTVNQTVGSSFNLPSDPTRSDYSFVGWYTARSGGTQVTSSTTVTTSSPTALYAHWNDPTEYGNYKSGGYSGTTITSLAMKVGETTTVYFTSPVSINNATFTSSNSSIVSVDSTGTGTVYQRSITLTAHATGTVTLKAKYTSGSSSYYKDLSITVTQLSTTFYRNYDSSDSTVVQTVNQTVGSSFSIPSDPIRQGYTFKGWYTTRTGGTQITSSTTVTTSSPTALYAHWGGEEEYGAYKSGSYSGTTITSLAMKVGETTTVYFTSPVDITGATFTSSDVSVVRIDSTGTGTIYQRSIVLTALNTGNVTLKAQYSSGSTSYYKDLSIAVTKINTLFYRNYDSSDSTVIETIGQTVNSGFVLPADPVRQGYTFAGWYTARSGGTQITSSTTVTTSSPTAVYAQWGGEVEYGAYKSGSYSGTTITSLAMKVGETTTVYFTSPVDITGATFTSSDVSVVRIDSTGTGTIYQRSIVLTALSEGTVTLKAQYSGGSSSYYKDLEITVTQLSTDFYRNYDSSDNVILDTINQTVNSTFVIPSDPTREGFTFAGWFTARENGTEVTSSTTVTTSSPTILYAHWESPQEVGAYKTGGYSGTVINSLTLYVGETKTIYFTSPVDISSATFTSSDTGIVTVDSTDIGTIYQRSITITAQSAGEVTLRADYVGSNTQYFKNLPITVTYLQTSFYVNHTEDDPTVLATINQPIGSYYNLPINPNRPGYNFSGWFTARDGGSEVDSATTVTTSSPTALYAHWTAKTFVVSFNASANGGTVEGPTSKPVTYNQPYGLLPSAKKTGNIFLGWFDATSGGNQITESTIVGIVADQTLYAQFEERDVLVWWDNGYVNGSLSIEFDFVTTSDNYTHEMEIPLVIYDGIEDDADGIKYFSDSGYTLSIVVPYNRQITCTLSGHGQTISDSFKSGSWVQFTLDVDAQKGTVTFNGTRSLGWNANRDFTFLNYETVFTQKIFDFSSEVTGLAISKIYHEDTGNGMNHPRFQVSATTTFLDTYGFVMIDPTLNIYSQFPNYDNLRLNLYSFAVYGETMTVNGHQFTLQGSRLSDLYYTVYTDEDDNEHYVIANASTEGAVKYDATLSNIYITWTNITSQTAEDRQCYLTFADDKKTIEMGSYPLNDLMISFTGIWYFTTALYEPYTAHETVYSMDWDSWFNLSGDAFLLVIAGLLIILTVAFSMIWKPSIIDYAVIIGCGVLSYILIGGL